MRLLNRPADAPWSSLQLSGSQIGRQPQTYEAEGQIQPILVDGLGDPLAPAWTPPAGDQRWYIIPGATSWDLVLGWLIQQAQPEHVPAALRRARSPHFTDHDLGATRSADLLVSGGGPPRRLTEVKAASGAAPETWSAAWNDISAPSPSCAPANPSPAGY